VDRSASNALAPAQMEGSKLIPRAAAVVLALITALLVTSIVVHARWTAQLRALPESFDLKLRILFEGCDGPTGQLYDLQFVLHNGTDEDVTIDWDASSLQLPEGREWHVVQPENVGEEDPATTVVPARSTRSVRVCPSQSRMAAGSCDQSWLHPTLFSDGASLRLRLAVLTSDGVHISEWIWGFHYEEPEGRSGFTLDSSLLPIALLVAAAAFAALILLL